MYNVTIQENKNTLPKIIKTYQHYEQCVAWATLKGYVYTAKGKRWLDPRIKINFDLDDLIEKGTHAWKDVDENWLDELRGND